MNQERYIIAFKGLKNGKHHFDFEVKDALFQQFDGGEIIGGETQVAVEMERNASMLALKVSITGSVKVECDRCLEELTLPVSYAGELIVRFADGADNYDGEVMWVSAAAGEVDLTQYIYESIVLSLPYQRVHGKDECNPEMLERFTIEN